MSNRKIFKYKGVRVNAFGLPISGSTRRIPKDKRVRDLYNISFESYFSKSAEKDLIVMYDIPHDRKKERDWFRRHLVKFGYIMIQRSVWVGPAPLPKDFMQYVKEIGLSDKLVTFKLAKPYSGKRNKFE